MITVAIGAAAGDSLKEYTYHYQMLRCVRVSECVCVCQCVCVLIQTRVSVLTALLSKRNVRHNLSALQITHLGGE